jgi:hypothetical protein
LKKAKTLLRGVLRAGRKTGEMFMKPGSLKKWIKKVTLTCIKEQKVGDCG